MTSVRCRLSGRSRQRATSAVAAMAMACLIGIAPVQAADKGTRSFVIRDWFTAVYESRFMDECPEGLNIGNDEYWWRGLSKEDRAKFTDNGLVESLKRLPRAMRRGPNGENVCFNPNAVQDPPMRVVEGKFSYGANIDGTTDGRATAKTCKHEKFTGVDGTVGVDNQFYRLVGCTYGWRHVGAVDLNANEMRGTSGLGMILVDISGVNENDPRNSDDVTVTFYRSIDQFALDPHGAPLPFSTYRIDTANGKPRYSDKLKGSIKNGKLMTDRGDVRLPFYGLYNFLHPVIKDMGLMLEIGADGKVATGQITGYYDLEQWLYYVNGTAVSVVTGWFSCPAFNTAARQLADGYPDPATGKCTALSSAFNIRAYAAFVQHPDNENRLAAK